MEYASGGDLLKLIKDRKKTKRLFGEEDIWKVLTSIARGLDGLHKQSILHRDIKSENIFFCGDTFKIGDMNVSKVKKDELQLTQTGTPYYASPEVWRD